MTTQPETLTKFTSFRGSRMLSPTRAPSNNKLDLSQFKDRL